MKFFQALCESVTRALGLSALAGYDGYDDGPTLQQPGGGHHHINHIKGPHRLSKAPSPPQKTKPAQVQHHHAGSPKPLHTLFPDQEDPFRTSRFHAVDGGERGDSMKTNEKLPGFPQEPEDDASLPPGPIFKPPNATPGFVCNYTAMRGWRHAAGGASKTAWLEKPIMDSDDTGGVYNIFTNYDQYAPVGITRQVRSYASVFLQA